MSEINEIEGKYYFFEINRIDDVGKTRFSIFSTSQDKAEYWARLINPEATLVTTKEKDDVLLPAGFKPL